MRIRVETVQGPNRHGSESFFHTTNVPTLRDSRCSKTVGGNSARRLRVAFRVSSPDVSVGRHPTHKELIAERQKSGTDEHPQDSSERHASQRFC